MSGKGNMAARVDRPHPIPSTVEIVALTEGGLVPNQGVHTIGTKRQARHCERTVDLRGSEQTDYLRHISGKKSEG